MKDIEFKETDIGAIPASWSVGRIGDLAKVQGGFAFKSDDFGDKGIGVIKIRNIASRRIDLLNVQRVSEEVFESVRKEFILQTGDVLIAMTGAELGKIGIIPETKDRFVLNQRVGKFVSSSQDDILYLYEILNSAEYQKRIFDTAHGSAQPNISSTTIESISIPIPSILERQKIAKVLFSIDEKIETNNQMNKTLEAIGQALFKQWFVDFDFPDKNGKPYKSSGGKMIDSELGEIPEGWAVKEISDCGEVVCGKTPPTADKDNYGDDIFFITIPDMRGQAFVIKTERRLSKKGATTQKKKELPPLAICVSCIATPGLVSLTSGLSHTNQQINSIVCNKVTSPFFMYYKMLDKSEEIKSMGLGGTATLNLNTGNFARIKVVVPEKAIMGSFHKTAMPFMERILSNSIENYGLCSIRDSLLPKLMSGKIRIDNPHERRF